MSIPESKQPLDPHYLSAIVDKAIQGRIAEGVPVDIRTLVSLAVLLDDAITEIVQCSVAQTDATESLVQVAVVASYLRRMDVIGQTITRH